MRLIHDQIVSSRCGLPSNNPSKASAPLNFRADLSGALATFAWDKPTVRPLGFEYQLYSAPFSLSHPDSMTLLWQGDALGKTINFSVSSPVWCWVRAVCNTQASPLVPGSFGLGLVPVVPVYTPPVGWSASLSPSAMTKVSSPATITAGPAAVTVNNGTTPVFSWHNPTSMSCIITRPGSSSTTFTASGMSPGETRTGTIWCRVSDNGGANVASLSISVNFFRTDFS